LAVVALAVVALAVVALAVVALAVSVILAVYKTLYVHLHVFDYFDQL
jgi:hypothetical protein